MREGTTILTLDNGYHLWTHTDNVGGKIRLLCLHGGPGGNHEYYENFAEKLKDIDVQVTMYDQLGSWYSDQPDFTKQENVDKFLKMDYFVDEIEEVRQKLGIGRSNYPRICFEISETPQGHHHFQHDRQHCRIYRQHQ